MCKSLQLGLVKAKVSNESLPMQGNVLSLACFSEYYYCILSDLLIAVESTLAFLSTADLTGDEIFGACPKNLQSGGVTRIGWKVGE